MPTPSSPRKAQAPSARKPVARKKAPAKKSTLQTTAARKAPRKKSLKLHDYLFPHKGNKYKPHIFRTASLSVIVVALLVLQAAYLAQTTFIIPKTNFLAAVLPAALVSLTNTDRAADNLAPVTEDPTLDEAAQDVANDMAAKGYFAHVSPTGQSPWYWLQSVGYHYQFAGENLAVNFTDSDQVENAWMQSPTHRANIEKPEYTKVGIGVANGMYEGKEATFVAEYFATPEPTTGEGPTPLGEPPVQEGTPATVPTPSGSGQIALAPPAPASAAIVSTAGQPLTKASVESQVLGTQTNAPAAAVGTAGADNGGIGASPTNTGSAAQSSAASPAAQPTPIPSTELASAPTSPLAFLAEVATSPTQTLLYIISALAVIVAILLIIEFAVKARLKYLEMTGGGLALLAFLIVLLVFNVFTAPRVLITNDSQPAQTSANGS